MADFDANTLTLSLVPSASEPALTTVRLSPETVVIDPGGQAVAAAVLARAKLVALTVETQEDGSVLATAVSVRSFARKVRHAPAETV